MEETMKCLKNVQTGNVIRVSDTQAHQMAGSKWSYTSKSEWKAQFKKVEEPKTESNEQKR